MELYIYEGAVLNGFNQVIINKWKGTTYATSSMRAKSNLMYQFKKRYGLLASAKIVLDSKPTRIPRDNNTGYYEKNKI